MIRPGSVCVPDMTRFADMASDDLRVEQVPAGGTFLISVRPDAEAAGQVELPGLVWPSLPGRWNGDDPGAALIAPNRVLIACSTVRRAVVTVELAAMRERGLIRVHDVGDGRVWFRLSGRRAAELLNCGIAIDLSPAHFAVGAVASVQLARVAILLRRSAEGFHLLVDASYADYLGSWLTRNARLLATLPV